MRLIEKLPVLSRVSVTLIPTTAVATTTATLPNMSNGISAISPWPSTSQPEQIYLSPDYGQGPITKTPLCHSGTKTESEKIRPFKIQKPSCNGDDNLLSYAISYRKLCHGQCQSGQKYIIPQLKHARDGDHHAHSVSIAPHTPCQW